MNRYPTRHGSIAEPPAPFGSGNPPSDGFGSCSGNKAKNFQQKKFDLIMYNCSKINFLIGKYGTVPYKFNIVRSLKFKTRAQ